LLLFLVGLAYAHGGTTGGIPPGLVAPVASPRTGVAKAKPGNKPGNKFQKYFSLSSIHAGFKASFN
jgi:hypothetical protein